MTSTYVICIRGVMFTKEMIENDYKKLIDYFLDIEPETDLVYASPTNYDFFYPGEDAAFVIGAPFGKKGGQEYGIVNISEKGKLTYIDQDGKVTQKNTQCEISDQEILSELQRFGFGEVSLSDIQNFIVPYEA